MTTELIDALKSLNSKTLKDLVKTPEDANTVVYDSPALIYALIQKKGAVAKLLIKAGADVNAVGKDGQTPIIVLASRLRDVKIGQLLAERGADLQAQSKNDGTALHLAVGTKKLDFAEWLLESGVPVDIQGGYKNDTPLLRCCRSDSGEMNANEMAAARFLIGRGADVNARNDSGENALTLAAASASADFLRELITVHGAKVSATEMGNTPLHSFAGDSSSDTEIWTLLIDAGADVDAQNVHGLTALHEAIDARNLKAVKFLVENGAKTDLKSKAGETARESATRQNREKILAFFDKNNIA